MRRVAIVGVGWSGFSPEVSHMSFREVMFEAAVRAYEDAGGLNPRDQVDAFISCQEDFWEGISIADEFAPDPVGGAMKSVFTVAGDGLQGVAQGYMMIKSGLFDVVVVESHAKPSDVLTLGDVIEFATDPITIRPLKLPNPHAYAALEASAYMAKRGVEEGHLAILVEKAKSNALKSPRAPYGARISADDYLASPKVVDPLRELDIAPFVDAAVVVVLASEDLARKLTDTPVWIRGIGWATETGTFELHDLVFPLHAFKASEMAYRQARIDEPAKSVSFAEVDNRYSFKELQFVEALRLAKQGEAKDLLVEGSFHAGGKLPVNLSGGALGEGVPFEAHGLARLLFAVEVLRGELKVQASREGVAVVHGWRGIPTTTSVVAVLGR